jgi:TonB family protein
MTVVVFADSTDPVPPADLGSADSVAAGDSSAARLPSIDEFVPVEVIAEMIYNEAAIYPREAEQFGIQGLVWVKALVSSDGSVRDATVYKSSGTRSLDAAAVESAFKCRFKPAMQGGKPVAMWVTYKVEFSLEGSGGGRSTIPDPDIRVDSRIDTVVWSLEGDSIAMALTDPKTSGDPSRNPDGTSDSTRSESQQQFNILILREDNQTRIGKQKATVLIDGGCAAGLKIGSMGDPDRDGDKVKLANVEVLRARRSNPSVRSTAPDQCH